MTGELDGKTQDLSRSCWMAWYRQSDIVLRAIEQMSNVHTAIIGPCIGVNRYEVGEEVIEAMIDAGIPREICAQERTPRPHLDEDGSSTPIASVTCTNH